MALLCAARFSRYVLNSVKYKSSVLKQLLEHKNSVVNRQPAYTHKLFQTCTVLCHGEYERQPPKSEEDVVNIRVIDRDGIEFDIRGKVGDNVMMLAQMHDVDIEGACEASLACCTCHVYVEEPYFERLDEPDVKEEDLLDMAPFLAENSRLSCQILLRKDLDGMVVRLPVGTRNMRVDQKGQQKEERDDSSAR